VAPKVDSKGGFRINASSSGHVGEFLVSHGIFRTDFGNSRYSSETQDLMYVSGMAWS